MKIKKKMGIQVEHNPELALRNIDEYRKGSRKEGECIPENIKAGQIYDFLKSGQRNYRLQGEIPLVETKGNQQVSKTLASIIILEATHFLSDDQPWTRGRYKVIETFDQNDNRIHFDGFNRIRH